MAEILYKEIIIFPPSDGKLSTLYYCNKCKCGGLSPMDKFCSSCGEKIKGLRKENI